MEVKVGDTIKIISMKGEPSYEGKTGVVEFIDDIGQIHGTWGGCAIIPEEDKFKVLVVTPKVKEQILIIRDTGLTNMFDVNAVQKLAFDRNLFELVNFLETNKKEYVQFIMYGD